MDARTQKLKITGKIRDVSGYTHTVAEPQPPVKSPLKHGPSRATMGISQMLTATAYDSHVEQLFNRIHQLHSVLNVAGVPYRIIGGMAVFIHVFEKDPLRARLTSDVDAGVYREHLPAIVSAAERAGLTYRHVAGVDMLVDKDQPRARSAVHLVFLNEKVRPEYTETIPDSPPAITAEGIFLASVADLVWMKLTSFRLKDQVHIQDLDSVGLITPEIEEALPDLLKKRLQEVRARE